MDSKLQQFIESGILEAYLSGAATEAEEREVLYMKQRYQPVQETLERMELDVQVLAQRMALPPPPDLWNRIEADLQELVKVQPSAPPARKSGRRSYQQHFRNTPDYIEVDAQDTHMRIHKVWRWVFAAVFVLGKVFLATAIYFYLENRQAQSTIQDMNSQIKELRAIGHK